MSHIPSTLNSLKDKGPLLASCQNSASPSPHVAGTRRDRSELKNIGAGGVPASKSFPPAKSPQGFWGRAVSLVGVRAPIFMEPGKFPLKRVEITAICRLMYNLAERRKIASN